MKPGRRKFAALAALAPLAPGLVLGSQSGGSRRLAVLLPGPAPAMHRYQAAVLERLAQHGFVAGKNLILDTRVTSYIKPVDVEQVRALLASKPDAVLTYGTFISKLAQTLTGDTPIVFTFVGDAVAYGVVKSERLPGGKVTGVSMAGREVNRKRIELLRELLPHAKRVALVASFGADVVTQFNQPLLRASAAQLGFELIEESGYSASGGFVPGVDAAVKRGAEALFVLLSFAGTGFMFGGEDVVRATLARRIPAVFQESEVVDMGGLISYGVNLVDEARRAGDLLAKVLAGANAGDLPIDQASRFELAVNLKTARAIGIEIPRSILLRADMIVE